MKHTAYGKPIFIKNNFVTLLERSEAANGINFGIHHFPIANDAVTRTISTRYHKARAEILFTQKGDRPRRLSVEEAMQLQGYENAA